MSKQIGDRLRLLREEAGYSQQLVSEKVGISDSSYQNYEYGKRDIPGDILKKFSLLYGVAVDYILGLSPHRNTDIKGDVKVPTADGYVDVPLYGSIAAGTPIEMLEVDDVFPIPCRIAERYPDAYLLKVKGESMNHVLPNGCYALVDPCIEVDHDNQPYALCVNGHEATVKRVHKLANGFELVPDSTDPTYKPKVYDYGVPGTEVITILGRVVYHVLPFDWKY